MLASIDTPRYYDYAPKLDTRRSKGAMMGIGKEPPFGLRLPNDLKQWVKDSARTNRRSMNSEVIARLEETRRQEEAKQQAEASK